MSEMPCSTSRGSANDAQVLADSMLAILKVSPAGFSFPRSWRTQTRLRAAQPQVAVGPSHVTRSASALAGDLDDITLERQEDGPLLQLARLALIVAEFGRCGGPMGVAERHTCLVLRLARACSEVWPVAAGRVGIWMTGSGRSRGRCTRRLTRT